MFTKVQSEIPKAKRNYVLHVVVFAGRLLIIVVTQTDLHLNPAELSFVRKCSTRVVVIAVIFMLMFQSPKNSLSLIVGYATDRGTGKAFCRHGTRLVFFFISVHMYGNNSVFCLFPCWSPSLLLCRSGQVKLLESKLCYNERTWLVELADCYW